jgi:hypothetical protein
MVLGSDRMRSLLGADTLHVRVHMVGGDRYTSAQIMKKQYPNVRKSMQGVRIAAQHMSDNLRLKSWSCA